MSSAERTEAMAMAAYRDMKRAERGAGMMRRVANGAASVHAAVLAAIAWRDAPRAAVVLGLVAALCAVRVVRGPADAIVETRRLRIRGYLVSRSFDLRTVTSVRVKVLGRWANIEDDLLLELGGVSWPRMRRRVIRVPDNDEGDVFALAVEIADVCGLPVVHRHVMAWWERWPRVVLATLVFFGAASGMIAGSTDLPRYHLWMWTPYAALWWVWTRRLCKVWPVVLDRGARWRRS